MDLYLKRVGDGLWPDGTESVVEFARLPFGKPLHCEVKQPRNVGMHRLYFALVHRIAQAKGVPSDAVDYVLRIASGHCEIIRTQKFGDLRVAKPLKFAQCDQLEFDEFFRNAVQATYSEFGIDPAVVSDLLAPQEAHLKERTA